MSYVYLYNSICWSCARLALPGIAEDHVGGENSEKHESNDDIGQNHRWNHSPKDTKGNSKRVQAPDKCDTIRSAQTWGDKTQQDEVSEVNQTTSLKSKEGPRTEEWDHEVRKNESCKPKLRTGNVTKDREEMNEIKKLANYWWTGKRSRLFQFFAWLRVWCPFTPHELSHAPKRRAPFHSIYMAGMGEILCSSFQVQNISKYNIFKVFKGRHDFEYGTNFGINVQIIRLIWYDWLLSKVQSVRSKNVQCSSLRARPLQLVHRAFIEIGCRCQQMVRVKFGLAVYKRCAGDASGLHLQLPVCTSLAHESIGHQHTLHVVWWTHGHIQNQEDLWTNVSNVCTSCLGRHLLRMSSPSLSRVARRLLRISMSSVMKHPWNKGTTCNATWLEAVSSVRINQSAWTTKLSQESFASRKSLRRVTLGCNLVQTASDSAHFSPSALTAIYIHLPLTSLQSCSSWRKSWSSCT